jgi:TfoX/Sxy family transcriptional regulator of competence genes
MAYDEVLAERLRDVLADRKGITEKRMFGGLAFLLDGKMFCGVNANDLMVRVGPDGDGAALAEPHVRPMDFTGRPLKGFVYVSSDGLATEAALRRWVETSTRFVSTVEARPKKRRRPRP